MTRIIAEESEPNVWFAWIEARPAEKVDGEGPIVAVRRLCDVHGISMKHLRALYQPAEPNRLEFTVAAVCSDCNGSGKFAGLLAAEHCQACAGTGRV